MGRRTGTTLDTWTAAAPSSVLTAAARGDGRSERAEPPAVCLLQSRAGRAALRRPGGPAAAKGARAEQLSGGDRICGHLRVYRTEREAQQGARPQGCRAAQPVHQQLL
eukprot:6293204-Prymnesium_polylepis.1